MGTYYYLDDPKSESGSSPVYEDDYFGALFSIASKRGLKITDKMILDELNKKKSHQKNKGKTNLYIDGTNLFAGQNDLFGPRRYLDFTYLMKEIKKITSIDQIFFYSSYMNTKQRGNLAVAEALFYRQVKETKNLFFYKGHRSPTSGKEKGVDVHLSVDIVRDVFLFNCKKVIIMSGDSDLIYPLEIAKSCQVDTAAIFLPNRFSLEMAYQADQAFVFNFIGKFKYNRKLPGSLKIVSIKKPRTINVRGR